jgi:hypothetical protein
MASVLFVRRAGDIAAEPPAIAFQCVNGRPWFRHWHPAVT